MKTTIKANNFEFSFTDEDIIEIDDVMFADDYNPHNHRMFLLHDRGFTLCVVCAESLQDAIDIAVDNEKLDRYLINLDDENDREDYLTSNPDDIACGFDPDCPEMEIDGVKYWWKIEPAFLGNAGEPFDIESLGYVEFPLPTKSIVRLYGEEISATSYHV